MPAQVWDIVKIIVIVILVIIVFRAVILPLLNVAL